MDEEKIKLAAILGAQQILLCKLYAMVYHQAGLSKQEIAALHDAMREAMPSWVPLKTIDPALSQLAASEIEEALKQYLERIEEEAGVRPKKS